MKALRWLGGVLAGLLVLLVIGAAVLWWWSGREGSAQWALQQAARRLPSLQAEGVTGSLRHGLAVQQLTWNQGGLRVQAQQAELAWQPLALLQRRLALDYLRAAQIRVEDRRPDTGERPRPPASLELPLQVAVDEIAVARLEWVGPPSVVLRELAARYAYDGERHRLDLRNLRALNGHYRGELRVAGQDPFELGVHLQGRIAAPVPGAGAPLPLVFQARADGRLADFDLQAKVQTEPGGSGDAQATLVGRVTPWEPLPLARARADFEAFDASAIWHQAPHTLLSGRVTLQPRNETTWAIGADLRNALPGPWDRQRVPASRVQLDGDWRLPAQAFVRQLQADVGGGKVQARGEWESEQAWRIEGTLAGVNPAAVHSAMAPLPLSGPATLRAEGEALLFDTELTAAGGAPPTSAGNELAAAVGALELRSLQARGRWAGQALSLPLLVVNTADARLDAALELEPAARFGRGRADLEAPGLRVRAVGSLGRTRGGGNAKVTLADVALAQQWLMKLPEVPPALAAPLLAGRAEAQFAWQGGWDDPEVDGTLTVPQLRPATGPNASAAWAVRDATLSLDGRLADARIELHAQASQGARQLTLDLAGPWWPTAPGRVAGAGRFARGPSARPGQRQRPVAAGAAAADGAVLVGRARGGRRLAGDAGRAAGRRRPSSGAGAGAGDAGSAHRCRRRCTVASPGGMGAGDVDGGRRTSHDGPRHGPAAGLDGAAGRPAAGRVGAVGRPGVRRAMGCAAGRSSAMQASLARSSGDVSVLADTAEGGLGPRAGGRAAGTGDAGGRGRSGDGSAAVGLGARRQRAGAHRHAAVAGRRWLALAGRCAAVRFHPRPVAAAGGVVAAGAAGLAAARIGAGRHRGVGHALRSAAGRHPGRREPGAALGGRWRRAARRPAARAAGRPPAGDRGVRAPRRRPRGRPGQRQRRGRLDGRGLQARLSVQIEQLRASTRSDREITLSGRLTTAIGPAAVVEVRGALQVDRARITLPDESAPRLGDDVVVRNLPPGVTLGRGPAPEAGGRSGQRPLTMDVTLDLGNDFRIQGRGIETRLAGALTVSGPSVTEPRLTGVIRTVGGEYQAYGQRLEIERGVLRFTGPAANPSLDILAVRPRLTQRVGVQVTGTAQSPFVRLHAEPDLPESEKLAWLVLGRPTASGGAETALLQSAAMALLQSRAGGGASGKGPAALLGLDELGLRRDGPEGPALTLGKRLGRDLYASYERSLAGTIGTLYIFYDLSQRLTVRLQAGDRAAADLIMTFAYD